MKDIQRLNFLHVDAIWGALLQKHKKKWMKKLL